MPKTPTGVVLLLALAVTALDAKIPSYRGKFNSLPCLAPYIRQMNRAAPANIEEAMLLPPYQAARLMEGIGEVSFPITTTKPELQAYFDQGIVLLHLMWYTEAERAFRQVAAADPDCSMAYWGLALANERFPARSAVYMKEAAKRTAKQPDLTDLERRWLNIYTNFWTPAEAAPPGADPLSGADRRRQRIEAFESIAHDFPDLVEARAFLLRHLVLDEYRGNLRPTSRYLVDLLARNLFEANPRHPSRHYRAFLWLNTIPERALGSVPEITGISPSVPDAWRYAAQLYAATGLFDQGIDHGDAALRVAHAHLRRDLAMPDEIDNLAANAAAHIDLLCSMGRLSEAVAASHQLIDFPRTAYLGKQFTLEDRLAGCFVTGRIALFQTLARNERWETILEELEPGGRLAPGTAWEDRAHSLYWRAIAAFNLGNTEAGTAAVADLEALFTEFRSKGTTNEVKAEIVRCLRGARTYRDLATGALQSPPDFEREPLPHFTDDLVSRALFNGGFPVEAITVATRHRADRSGQILATANFCDLLARDDKTDQALVFFDSTFRRNATTADPDIAALQWVQPMVKALQLRGNWKLPPLARDEDGVIADPDSLGPAVWSPPEAPAWSLPDPARKPVTLESYRDKPVLVIFFLGVGCVYCAEQLQVFKPHVEAFEEAGIPIIAISSDSIEDLALALGPDENGAATSPYPFPIVSDEKGDTFRAYRAWSDFEEAGMHGTFLIGPEGELLWKDVSHEPFLHPEFLLNEAGRLLGVASDE